MASLGAKLTQLRLKTGASLQDIAEAVGASKAHIWQLEKGKAANPSMTVIQRLADHFGVSVSYLVGEDHDAPDADVELQRMFRQAQTLDDRERAILDGMLKQLLQTRDKTD